MTIPMRLRGLSADAFDLAAAGDEMGRGYRALLLGKYHEAREIFSRYTAKPGEIKTGEELEAPGFFARGLLEFRGGSSSPVRYGPKLLRWDAPEYLMESMPPLEKCLRLVDPSDPLYLAAAAAQAHVFREASYYRDAIECDFAARKAARALRSIEAEAMAGAQLAWDIRHYPENSAKQWSIRLKDQTSQRNYAMWVDAMGQPEGYSRPESSDRDYSEKMDLYCFRRIAECEEPTSKHPLAFLSYISTFERSAPLSEIYLARAIEASGRSPQTEYTARLWDCLQGWKRVRGANELFVECDELIHRILPGHPERSDGKAGVRAGSNPTVVVLRTEGSSLNAAVNIGFLLEEDHESLTLCPAIHQPGGPAEAGTLRKIDIVRRIDWAGDQSGDGQGNPGGLTRFRVVEPSSGIPGQYTGIVLDEDESTLTLTPCRQDFGGGALVGAFAKSTIRDRQNLLLPADWNLKWPV